MRLSRRDIMRSALLAPALTPALTPGLAIGGMRHESFPAAPASSLPDKDSFAFDGVYLNAAYVHPMSRETMRALADFDRERMRRVATPWPTDNPRNEAVASFARLINADPAAVAVVPSTMEGENLIAAAIGLGPDAGVVSDAYHYSPEIYQWLHRARGVPFSVAAARDHRIEMSDLEALIDSRTRLVAVTLVGSDTGFTHDLKALCEMAHAKGALVYADVIQAVGAMPLDVRATGVDFCCAGTYKWMMGAFGTAFLYVRPDRLPFMTRSQVGWRQVKRAVRHISPFDPPGSPAGEWVLGSGTAATFEVSTPNWSGLAAAIAGLSYIHRIGVSAIMEHRQPLIERLQQELPRYGYQRLTPLETRGPIVSFAFRDAKARLTGGLAEARVAVQLGKNIVRLSPSVYNDMRDIEAAVATLAALAK